MEVATTDTSTSTSTTDTIEDDTTADDTAPTAAALGYEFAKLIVPFRQELYSYASRRCGSAAMAEDIIQETFLRAWRNWSNWVPEGDPFVSARAWLYRIVNNTHTNVYHQDRLLSETLREHPAEVKQGMFSADEDGFRGAIGSPLGDEVETAIARLSPDRRVIIEAFYVRGLTTPQIAAELGIPRNTVGTRLLRARQDLEKRLSAYALDQYRFWNPHNPAPAPCRAPCRAPLSAEETAAVEVALAEGTGVSGRTGVRLSQPAQGPQTNADRVHSIVTDDDDVAFLDS